MAVAVNATGVRPPTCAVTRSVPVTVPRVQVVCARPLLLLVDDGGETVPAPTPTSQSTRAPEMVFPDASVTVTASGTASAVPTTAV